MCGIVGVINWQGEPVDAGVVRRMTHKLKHRGPDDNRIWIKGEAGLGHSRLSIIDLTAAGAQPMASEDGRYQIVFNGEIYNYRELREKYCRGVAFKSTSDTEVLLKILMRHGTDILPEIKGMFALALWDSKNKTLMLARDAFGKKPLYYWKNEQVFLFASEIKALKEHPLVKRAADKKALVSYLIYEFVPVPETGWQDIKQIPMGCIACVSASGMKITQWWQMKFLPKKSLTEDEAAEEFDHLMMQAVKRRLVSDVPVGLLLSGGIDSTAVGWYMKKIQGGELHSFSIGFKENMFNEGGYAQQAASVLGTRHNHKEFGLEEFKQYLPQLNQMDIPFGDSSLLPTWAVSDLASKQVKVVLDGDGSDELLGGYGVFEAAAWAEKLPRVPQVVSNVAATLSQQLPTRYEYFTIDFKIKSFMRGFGLDRAARQQAWLGSFNAGELRDLLTEEYMEMGKEAWSQVSERANIFKELNWFDGMSGQIITDYLQNDILVKLDRAAMTFGLEARTPFLDVDLAEFIMRLPIEYKRGKRLLKRVMRGRIPDSIIDRRKQGFAIPLGHWLRGELYGWAANILSEKEVGLQKIIKTEQAMRLLEEHRRGRADNRKKLWTLIALTLWQKQLVG